MVKRILALSLLMVGLAGCGSGGGAESELATENTLLSANDEGGEGANDACQDWCGKIADGTKCMGTWMRVKNCESTRSINYHDCVSGC